MLNRMMMLMMLVCAMVAVALSATADASSITVVTQPWPIKNDDPPELGFLDMEKFTQYKVFFTCTDPDNCGGPYSRESGHEGTTLVAYNSSSSVVDFLRNDDEPFMECWQLYDSTNDEMRWAVVLPLVKDDINGGYHWPGVNSADGWPYKVSCQASESGNSVVTQTVLAADTSTRITGTTITLATGYAATLDDSSLIVKHKLPSGTYASGYVNGKLDVTTTWSHVKAYVEEGGSQDYITYMVGPEAEANEGFFPLVKDGSGSPTPFEFTRP
jgi:hypothetical protein